MALSGKLVAIGALAAALGLAGSTGTRAGTSHRSAESAPSADHAAEAVASSAKGEGRSLLCPTLSAEQARVRYHDKTYDLRLSEGLIGLASALDEELQENGARGGTDGEHDTEDSDREDRDALAAMRSWVDEALKDGPAPCDALVTIAEIGDALELASRRPVRKRIDVVQVPSYYLNLLRSSVGEGRTPAADLLPPATGDPRGASDPSLRDPAPSSFWSRPKDVAGIDVLHAFGPILDTGREPCVYDEPKTSYGTTPGFSVRCGERFIKIKFGAVKFGGRSPQVRDSEPTASRLFGALGYHVEPNDFASEIRVRYDRRMLIEFNSRKDLSLTITVLGFIPVYRLKVQGDADPFSYVSSAVLKDGRVLSPERLERRLLSPEVLARSERAARKSPPGTKAEHYRADAAEFEETIDHLVLHGANIQVRASGGKNIGPWAWDRLGHERRRELRGAGLLAAWMNYFDARWDNNRLKLASAENEAGAHPAIVHAVSDLGSALGRAESFRVAEGNLVNEFPWTFTEPPRKNRKGRETKPFRIVSYKPVMPNGAFREMTVDDARWMARLIAQLTEDQMEQALIASGFGSAEVKLYTEKLVSRRDRMIEDLGLGGEIAPLRPRGSVRVFDYDPSRDGPVRAALPDGSAVTPTTESDLVVRAGRVEPR